MTKIIIGSSPVKEIGKHFKVGDKVVIPYTLEDGSVINCVSDFQVGDTINIYLVKSKYGLSLSYDRS